MANIVIDTFCVTRNHYTRRVTGGRGGGGQKPTRAKSANARRSHCAGAHIIADDAASKKCHGVYRSSLLSSSTFSSTKRRGA